MNEIKFAAGKEAYEATRFLKKQLIKGQKDKIAAGKEAYEAIRFV